MNIVKSKSDLKEYDVITTKNGDMFIVTDSKSELTPIKSSKGSTRFEFEKVSSDLKNTGGFGDVWDFETVIRDGKIVFDRKKVVTDTQNLQDLKDELAKKENEIKTLKAQNDLLRIENQEIRAHSHKLVDKINELEVAYAWQSFVSEMKR